MSGKPFAINGIPALGFGTWPLSGDEAFRSTAAAIEVGYRHIDTAQGYDNEREVGRAINASGVPRNDLFVTTKVAPENLGKSFLPSVRMSLDALDCGQADLLLIHWPPADDALDRELDQLVEAANLGLTKRIGVSNYTSRMLRQAKARSPLPLATNQVEFHPLLDQSALKAAATDAGSCLSAYCPLVRGKVFGMEPLAAIAKRAGRSEAAVVLRWIIQQGVVALSMTTKRENAAANLTAYEFELPEADMAAITAMTAKNFRSVAPANMAARWTT